MLNYLPTFPISKTFHSSQTMHALPHQIDLHDYIIYNISNHKMKYLAAYALLALSGKKDINTQDVKGLLGSVQSHATDAEINEVINSLRGKTVHQLIAEGQGRLGNAPTPAAAKVADKKDAKKDEKKEEPKKKAEEPKKKVEEAPKEQQDADLGDLFG